LISVNPVKWLSQARAWYRVDRRDTVLRPPQLKPWFAAVLGLSAAPHSNAGEVRDYLLFLLLTGARRTEAAKLKWTQVDLDARTFTMVAADTKGKRAHTLPLPDYLHAVLVARKKVADGAYVFPGEGEGGYLVEVRRMLDKVIEKSGVVFTPHDLRRTFVTVAESLDIPAYALKRLLNHKMKDDVTAGYIIMDVERLRGPMQKITDYMLRAAELRPSATVSDVGDRKAGT
jgi:integrase